MPADQTAGVNDRVQLAAAHRVFNARLLEAHMRAGVTVVDPATTWVDADVALEPDVTLRPGVVPARRDARRGRRRDRPGDHAHRHHGRRRARGSPRTAAIGAEVGADVTVGPYAYLRPGTALADGVHVGTYVEIKGSRSAPGRRCRT